MVLINRIFYKLRKSRSRNTLWISSLRINHTNDNLVYPILKIQHIFACYMFMDQL